jgi:hypothetical protein
LRNILYDSNFPFGFWLNGLFCNCCTRAAALPCTWIKERRCTRDLVVSPWPYRDLSPPTPWGHRRVLLLSFHLSLSLSLSLSSLNSLFLPQTPSWWAQETPEGWVVRAQGTSHKPHDAPSLAQQRLRANPLSWLAYKRLPDPPWKHFAKRKVRCDSQTCCKIPMRICFLVQKV